MPRSLIDLFPEHHRNLYAVVYWMVSTISVYMPINSLSHKYASLTVSALIAAIWATCTIAAFFLAVRHWNALQRFRTAIVRTSHGLIVFGFLLWAGVVWLRELPLVRLLSWPAVVGALLVIFIGGTWLLVRLQEKASIRVASLLGDRQTLSRSTFLKGFGAGWILIGMMSADRRRVFFLAGGLLVVLTIYVIVILARNGLAIHIPFVLVGFLLVDSLFENLIFAELAEKKGAEGELETARKVQMGLMPTSDPDVPGFDIAGACVPAHEVGGDFYDYVWLDKKRTKLGIAVADVSGKAMKAAMTAVMTSGMLYSEVQKSSSPKEVLRRINHPLYLRSDKRIFTALAFAVLDTRTKNLTYSCAGQTPPVLVREGKVQELKIQGLRLPLGVKDDLEYKELKLKLKKGDLVVFHTDGIVEAMNPKKEMYGFEKMQEGLVKWNDLSAVAIRDRLLQEVKEHAGTAAQHDDQTVVLVKLINQGAKAGLNGR